MSYDNSQDASIDPSVHNIVNEALIEPESPSSLIPRAKRKYSNYVHVSKASKLKETLFGTKIANQMVGAKGTFCKKCQAKTN